MERGQPRRLNEVFCSEFSVGYQIAMHLVGRTAALLSLSVTDANGNFITQFNVFITDTSDLFCFCYFQ